MWQWNKRDDCLTINLQLCISQFQQCPSTPPPPPPRADPGELGLFENKLANAPSPGQNSCSNAKAWWLKHVKNVLLSSFLVLLSAKSKLIQAKLSPSWVWFPIVSAKIGHSTALASHFMSYLDVFNKKLTVFADEFVTKEATMLYSEKNEMVKCPGVIG